MKSVAAFLSLFTSFATLFCCALPALFVLLGFGATFAGLVSTFPQMIWLSENKNITFIIGGVLLASGWIMQVRAQRMDCPVDPNSGEACKDTRDWSRPVFFISLALYLVGLFFAYFAQHLL